MPVMAAMMAASSLARGEGFTVGKTGARGVGSSGEGVRAHFGIDSGFTTSTGTVNGACRKGLGDGAVDLQIGVVGVEPRSASVSMSEEGAEASSPGGGVVRSRMVTFFFLRFGLVRLRGEGLAALGVRIARLRVLDSSSSSLVCWSVVLDEFFSCWSSSAVFASRLAWNCCRH